MAYIIIHDKGSFNLYSSVMDMPVFDSALTLDELIDFYREEYGTQGLKELPDRINRAVLKGTSSMINKSLEETICVNAEGLEVDEFIYLYLTKKE